jgi:hypothetical protein
MRTSGERMADQCAVWADIDEKSRRMQAESETSAAAEMYERSRAKLEAFVAGLEPVPRQAGALFVINGAIAGMDVFDSPSTWRKSMRKLVHSYGLDAFARAESASAKMSASLAAPLWAAAWLRTARSCTWWRSRRPRAAPGPGTRASSNSLRTPSHRRPTLRYGP